MYFSIKPKIKDVGRMLRELQVFKACVRYFMSTKTSTYIYKFEDKESIYQIRSKSKIFNSQTQLNFGGKKDVKFDIKYLTEYFQIDKQYLNCFKNQENSCRIGKS